MSEEAWVPVRGFEGCYSVSSLGRVRREAPGHGTRVGRVLKATVDGRGYRMVELYRDAIRRKKKVHTVVAEAFLGERPAGHDIRHLDGDRLNNAAVNLAYGTRSENLRDSVRHGTHPESVKTHCKRGHEFTPENTRVETTGSRRCRACVRVLRNERKKPV